MPENLRTERDGDVLRITFTRPDRRNAFDAALIAELAEAFVAVGRARAVVLAGDGPSFSAGADVDWMRSSVDLSYEENVADANALRAMLEAIDGCPAPVVARVQGHALGGGAGLVAAADIAIAAPDAVFAFSEVKLGIIPAVISPFALARIGPGAARRYFVTGERFDAETALRIGLVHEVAEDLDAAVERVVGELLSAGPQAARWAKRLVRERPDGPETARWIAERRTSDEGAGGPARLPREALAELARLAGAAPTQRSCDEDASPSAERGRPVELRDQPRVAFGLAISVRASFGRRAERARGELAARPRLYVCYAVEHLISATSRRGSFEHRAGRLRRENDVSFWLPRPASTRRSFLDARAGGAERTACLAAPRSRRSRERRPERTRAAARAGNASGQPA